MEAFVRHLTLALSALLAVAACEAEPEAPPSEAPVETLPASLPGAPTQTVGDARLGCLGKAPKPATGGALELTGYVRALADPGAKQPPPLAEVVARAPDGSELGKGGSDVGKGGRVSVSVPVKPSGFVGSVTVTAAGFLDWTLQVSRPVTASALDGWAWLTKPDEAAARAKAFNVVLDPQLGLLVGAVHDCEAFGIPNAMVRLTNLPDALPYFVEGFNLVGGRTFTTQSGRFVVPNVPPGVVEVKAFARRKAGGPLELIGAAKVAVVAGKMTAVSLQPRTGAQ